MATGELQCSDLFDHHGHWNVEVGGGKSVAARRISWDEGAGGYFTWCGEDIRDAMTRVCITWRHDIEEQSCNSTLFQMNVVSHREGGVNQEYRSVPTSVLQTSSASSSSADSSRQVVVYQVAVTNQEEAEAIRPKYTKSAVVKKS